MRTLRIFNLNKQTKAGKILILININESVANSKVPSIKAIDIKIATNFFTLREVNGCFFNSFSLFL